MADHVAAPPPRSSDQSVRTFELRVCVCVCVEAWENCGDVGEEREASLSCTQSNMRTLSVSFFF
jgi:hypothetical protein